MSAVLDTLKAKGLKLRRDGNRLIVTPKSALNDELLTVVREHKAELLDELDDALPDAKMEERRQAVLAKLRDNPNIARAVLIDERADPGGVIVAVAIRGEATFEMRVPKANADAFTILELVDKHSAKPASEKRAAP